jgi:hypothetical protein
MNTMTCKEECKEIHGSEKLEEKNGNKLSEKLERDGGF